MKRKPKSADCRGEYNWDTMRRKSLIRRGKGFLLATIMLIEQQYNAKDLPQDGWSNARFGLPEVSFNPLFWKKWSSFKRGGVYKKSKRLPPSGNRGIFLKKHYKNYSTTLGVIFFYAGYLECLITAVEGVWRCSDFISLYSGLHGAV